MYIIYGEEEFKRRLGLRIYYNNYVIKLPGPKESGIRVESGVEKTRVGPCVQCGASCCRAR